MDVDYPWIPWPSYEGPFCGSRLRENGACKNGSGPCHSLDAWCHSNRVELMGCGKPLELHRRVRWSLLAGLESGAAKRALEALEPDAVGSQLPGHVGRRWLGGRHYDTGGRALPHLAQNRPEFICRLATFPACSGVPSEQSDGLRDCLFAAAVSAEEYGGRRIGAAALLSGGTLSSH